MFSLLTASAEGKVIAKLGEVNGEVEIVLADGTIISGKTGGSLLEGSSVRTGIGTAEIEFIGGDFLMVFPNTKIQIKEEKGEDDTITRKIGVNIGKVWGEIKPTKNLKTDFVTRTTVAGVRGSQIQVEVDKDGVADFLVGKGALVVTVIINGQVFEVTVTSGKSSTVVPGLPPTTPETFEPGTVPTSKAEVKEALKDAIKEAIKVALEEEREKGKDDDLDGDLDDDLFDEIADEIAEEIAEQIAEEILEGDATLVINIIFGE